MAKAVKAVGTAILIVGAVVATGGMALAMGAGVGALGAASLATSAVLSVGSFSVSAGALLSVGSLVSSIGGSLAQPKVSSAGGALGWVGDPNGPMHFAAGRIAVGGDLRHKAAYGPNDRMFFSAVTVVSDAGPIDAFEGFTANDVPVTFGADGKANSSFYSGKLWRRTQRGFQPEASYLASPSGLEGGATLPNWGPQHKLSAKAATILTMVENSKGSAYKSQQPRPREIIRGLLVYDWRRDSTYPGGSGPQRLNDPSTWAYSANPILWSVKWLLGLWEGPNGKGAPQVDYQVGGIGTRWENIDIAAFTEAANITDTHGWTCAAWPSTDDDKAQVLDAFLQAGGAYYIERAGKASCIHRAAPRVSVATITAADTAGPIELDTSASYLDRKNTGIATYLSEADGWKMTALPEVTSPQWVTEDGGRQRTAPVTYSYVDKAKQASELMCLAIAHTREGISGRIPLKSYMQGIGPGSAFTITEPEFVLDGLKCLCLETSYDANTGVHTVTFVSETDAKYPYAFGQTPNPPAPPALTPVDPTHVSPPQPGDWTIIPRPPAPGGGQLPGFDLGGIVSNETATAIIVEYGPAATGPWTQAYQGPPTVTSIPIDGLQPGATYYIAVQYQRNQNYSDRYVYGPYEAPGLIAGGLSPDAAEKVAQEVLGRVGDIAGGVKASDELAEVVIETILNEQNSLEREAAQRVEDLAAEASQRVEDLAAEAVARGEAFTLAVQQSQEALNDYSASASMTFATIVGMNGGLAATLNESKSYTNGQVSSAMSTVYTKAQTDAGLASTLQDARSYTDDFKSEANLTYATQAAMASGLASTLNSSQSYTDGKVATAVSTVYTKAEVDAGRATTLQEAKSYSDGKMTEASLLFSTKAERESGDAAAVLQAKAYTDDFKSEANLTYATQAAMASGLASTLNESKSFTDGKVAAAMATVYTKAEVDSGRATTLQEAKSYSDAKATEASLTYATKAERENGDAATYASMKSYVDDFKLEANLTFAAQSSLNGVSATAALALSTAQSADGQLNEARIRLVTAASGGQPAVVEMFSGRSGGSYIRFGAQQIGFGGNTEFEDATDTLVTTTGSVRYITAWGAPFGPDALTYWVGPSNVSTANATKAAAEAAGGQWRDATGGSFFGGQTIGGPFDSGAPNASVIGLGTNWTTMAQTGLRYLRNGSLIARASWRATLSTDGAPPPAFHGLLWRIVTTNETGGDLRVVASGYVEGPADISNVTMGQPFERATVSAVGRRRLLLQLAIDPNDNTAAASAHSAQFDGLYAQG